jgi:hypothetical protein
MMKLQFKDISANLEHPETLCVQMRWSKNISEERESPRQIVLGSLDERICTLLNLAIYIESECIETTIDQFVFGNGVRGDRVVRSGLNAITLLCINNQIFCKKTVE